MRGFISAKMVIDHAGMFDLTHPITIDAIATSQLVTMSRQLTHIPTSGTCHATTVRTSKIPARVQPTAYYMFACISLSCVTKCHELTQDIAMCGLRFVNGSQQKATLFVDKNLLLTGRFPFRLDFSS